MNLSRYLVLHKTEWDRLKRKHIPEQKYTEKEEYIKTLNELSQNWIKTWPDTMEGHVYQLEKKKGKDYTELIETVKQFVSNKKDETKTESIKKAKELIFENSCYGQQLKSALLESKTLEERDEQVKFQKQIKQEAALRRKLEPRATSLQNCYEMEVNEKTVALCKKQKDIETAKFNKDLFEEQNKKKILEKDENKRIVDEWAIQKLQEQGAEIRDTNAKLEREEIKQCEADKKKIEELKEAREKAEQRKRRIWCNYQDRVRMKGKIVFDQLHKSKMYQNQKIYDDIKKSNEEKNKRYNDFIEKGIERWLSRCKILENLEAQTKAVERDKRKKLDEENKMIAESNRQMNMEERKCSCGRQSFIGNNCERAKKKEKLAPSFLIPKNKLLEDLKAREKEKYNKSSNAAHAFFAQRANDTLQECRYKNKPRKVVDDYRRSNCLYADLLHIPNY